jgi:hypothetical protein
MHAFSRSKLLAAQLRNRIKVFGSEGPSRPSWSLLLGQRVSEMVVRGIVIANRYVINAFTCGSK